MLFAIVEEREKLLSVCLRAFCVFLFAYVFVFLFFLFSPFFRTVIKRFQLRSKKKGKKGDFRFYFIETIKKTIKLVFLLNDVAMIFNPFFSGVFLFLCFHIFHLFFFLLHKSSHKISLSILDQKSHLTSDSSAITKAKNYEIILKINFSSDPHTT